MANDSDGVIEKIRMVLDEASAQALEKGGQNAINKATDPAKATRNLSLIERGVQKLKAQIAAAAAAFAAMFALNQIGRFLRNAYETANEAEAVWARLGATLRGVGVEFKDVRGEIEANAKEMQRLTTMGDEDFADTLTTLIQYSGDYEKALGAVSVVADLAAAKQIDFTTASDLVGKAMIGQTGTLLRYGIVVEKGGDAVEVMRAQFAGMAGAEADTFKGSMEQRKNAVDDLNETIGRFIQRLIGGQANVDKVTESVQRFDGWLQRNKGSINVVIRALRVLTAWWLTLADAVVFLFNAWNVLLRGPILGFQRAARTINDVIAVTVSRVRMLAEAVGLDSLAAKMRDMESDIRNQADQWEHWGNKSEAAIKKSIDRMKELAAAVPGRFGDALTLPEDADDPRTETPPPKGDGTDGGKPEKKPPKEKTADELFQERLDLLSRAAEFETTRAGALAELMDIERRLAEELASGNASFEERIVLEERLAQVREGIKTAKPAEKMSEMTKMILEDVELVNDALMNMGKGSGDSVLQAIAKIAKGEAMHDAVRTIQQLGFAAFQSAMGNAAGASKHLKAAALFAKSAAAWGAVSMTGGGGGSSGGAGAAAGGAGGASATSPADNAGRVGNELHIHVDGFNPNRPDHVRLLGDGVREVVEQFGGGVFVNGARTN